MHLLFGAKNPYRYKGYRYGAENGPYYLQSRYYNADWGRSINGHAIIRQNEEMKLIKVIGEYNLGRDGAWQSVATLTAYLI